MTQEQKPEKELEHALSQLQKDVKYLKQELFKVRAEYTKIKEQNQYLNNDNKKLLKFIESIFKELQGNKSNHINTTNRIDTLTSRVAQAEKNLESAKESVSRGFFRRTK